MEKEVTTSPSPVSSLQDGSLRSPAPLPVTRLFTRRKACSWLVLWSVLALIFIIPAARFSDGIQGSVVGSVSGSSEIVRAQLVKNFSTALAFPIAIVWDGTDIPVDQSNQVWDSLLDKVRTGPFIEKVTDGEQTLQRHTPPGWHVAFVAVKAELYPQAEGTILPLRDLLKEVPLPGKNRPLVTGGPAFFVDLNQSSTEALRQGEFIAVPITLLILIFVFRSIVAAFLPVLVAAIGVTLTLGTLRLCAQFMPMTFFVPNLVTMLGLGIGIDYCLIYLARFRRERLITTTQEALRITASTAGKTVLVSAVLVMSGFLSLLFVPMQCFISIALGGIFVVASVAAATVTLLPSLILVLGNRLEWGQIPLSKFKDHSEHLAQKWSRIVVSRPWTCFLSGLFLLDILIYPVMHIQMAAIRVSNLPSTAEARKGYESLNLNLGSGWMMPTIILVQHNTPQGQPSSDWMGVDQLSSESALIKKLRDLPHTLDVLSVADTSGTRHQQQVRMAMLTSNKDPSQELIIALCQLDPESHGAGHWLEQIQALLKTEENPTTHYFLGGLPLITMETDEVIFHSLPMVVFVTLCTTFTLLVWFMRSIFVPLKAIALNLLCVLATYGFLVACYQTHIGHFLTDLPNIGGINSFVLIICFCALFGLSMDYEVFILSAVRESWLDTHDIHISIEEGLRRTAGIITSAALIMISVFLCFAFAGIVETQQLGIGLSLAVFLDATVIRLLCVPSAMALMGRWTFWFPGKRKKPRRPRPVRI